MRNALQRMACDARHVPLSLCMRPEAKESTLEAAGP